MDSWWRVPLTTCTVSVESFQTHCHQSMQLLTKWNTDLLRVSPVSCLLDGNRPRANSLRHYITWRDRCRNRTPPSLASMYLVRIPPCRRSPAAAAAAAAASRRSSSSTLRADVCRVRRRAQEITRLKLLRNYW